MSATYQREGPTLSNTVRETPKWFNHYVFTTLPPPPTLQEQQAWVASSEYKQQQSKYSKNNNYHTALHDTSRKMEELRSQGAQVLTKLAAKESSHKTNQQTTAWTTKMVQNGTIADKISALTLQMKYLQLTIPTYMDSLLSIAQRKGNKDTTLALEALRDLFIADILPNTRKLRYFNEQPWIVAYTNTIVNPSTSTIPPLHPYRGEPKGDVLAMFYLEDVVKRSYGKFLEVITDQLKTENFPHIKRHRVQVAFDLLAAIPEQENTLLVLIINKFGDSDRGIVSQVQMLLDKLINKSPALKLPVVKEMERLIFRPHIKQRTQYFAILFIANLFLSKNDIKLAQYLLTMYLTLFQIVINDAIPLVNDRQLATQAFIEKNKAFLSKSSKGKKAEIAKKKAKQMTKHSDGGISTRILGALLTGVSRCIPYAIPSDLQTIPDHLKTDEQKQVEKVLVAQVDQLIHCAAQSAQTNGNVCVQSLALVWQILATVDNPKHKQQQQPQPLTKKKNKQQIEEEVPTTLSRDPFYRCLYSILLFPQPFTCSRVKIFLNILFKSIAADSSPTRVIAMVKRLLQNVIAVNTQTAASILYIISHLCERHPCIYESISRADTSNEVTKHDILTTLQYHQYLQKKNLEDKAQAEREKLIQEGKSVPIEHENKKTQLDFEIQSIEKITVNDVECYKVIKVRRQFYDPFEGDPLYSRSDTSGLFETFMCLTHFHPTLNLWVQNIINGEPIQYSGDPIKDFTSIAFLESWLNKKSKKHTVSNLSPHQPQRLIVDPEMDDYMKQAQNAFITNFKPLYTNHPNDPRNNKKQKKVFKGTYGEYEDEEAFADHLIEHELLRIGGGGKGKSKKLAKGSTVDVFDFEDFGDFDDEIGENEGDDVWDDSIAYMGQLYGEGEQNEAFDFGDYNAQLDFNPNTTMNDGEDDDDDDEDDEIQQEEDNDEDDDDEFDQYNGYDDEFDDEDEDDSDFDESTLVSLDWDSLDPSKGTVAEVSESEEEQFIQTQKAKKAQKGAPTVQNGKKDASTSKTTVVPTKTPIVKQQLVKQATTTTKAPQQQPQPMGKKDKATFTAKGVFDMDDDSDDDSDDGKKSSKLKKSTKSKQIEKSKDMFDELDLSDLDDFSDDGAGGSDSDDDGGDGEDLRDILDDDEVVAELLEESSNNTTKRDKHAETMSSVGLGGTQTGAVNKRKAPNQLKKADKNNKKSQSKPPTKPKPTQQQQQSKPKATPGGDGKNNMNKRQRHF